MKMECGSTLYRPVSLLLRHSACIAMRSHGRATDSDEGRIRELSHGTHCIHFPRCSECRETISSRRRLDALSLQIPAPESNSTSPHRPPVPVGTGAGAGARYSAAFDRRSQLRSPSSIGHVHFFNEIELLHPSSRHFFSLFLLLDHRSKILKMKRCDPVQCKTLSPPEREH